MSKKKKKVHTSSQAQKNRAVTTPLGDSQKPAETVAEKANGLPASNQDELKKADVKPHADERVKELKKKLAEETEKAKNAQSDIDTLRNQKQQLAEENDTLKRKIQALEKNSTKELEKTRRSLRDSERKRNNLKSEIAELSTRLAEYKQKTEEAPVENEPVNISSTTSTFRIYLSLEEQEYRGRIEHNLSKETLKFIGLDFTSITDFIDKHKPTKEEKIEDSPGQTMPESTKDSFVEPRTAEGPPGAAEKRPEQPAIAETMLRRVKLFEGICLKQNDRLFEVTQSLSPDDGFAVDLKLLFSSIRALQQLEGNRFSFQVDMHARKVGDSVVIAKNGLADEVPADTCDYECSIPMPQLDSGDYDLSIYALVPAARFEGKERLRININ
ncbi:MAG: hypothetical protein ACE5G1_10365 [bacterium]